MKKAVTSKPGRKPAGDRSRMKTTVASRPQPRKASVIDPSFAPVVAAFAGIRDVTGGRMMSAYGLKVGSKIFAMFARGQFTVKLPRERVEELLASGKGRRFDPGHGRLMKDWVTIAAGNADWVELAKEAYLFVKRGAR